MGLTGFNSWISNFKNIPVYGDNRRDRFLSEFWKEEPILAGAINTMVKRMKSTGYTIQGGRNNAIKWARKLQGANDGKGWQNLVNNWVQDYLTTDLGALLEIGSDADGTPQALYNVDILRCYPWFDNDFPMLYMQPNGDVVKLAKDQIIHNADMASPREYRRGRGYCLVSRVMRAAEAITAIYDYEMQRMGKLPPMAVAAITGVTKQQFLDSWEEYKQEREKTGLDVYTGVFWIGGDDPNMPISIELTDIARLPEQFDRNGMMESWAKTIALNMGFDVGELWLIQHTGATKGSQTVQHQKALGKGTGEVHAMLEMALNTRVLPADVTFEFDYQDGQQAQQLAETMKANIENLIKLYTLSMSGSALGKAQNTGAFGGGQTKASGAKPPNVNKDLAIESSTTEVDPGTLPKGDEIPKPLISREQAIDLGTRWNIFPTGFFGQEVMTVAGMILKEANLWNQDDQVVVTHDMKCYRADGTTKALVAKDASRLLLSRLKENDITNLLTPEHKQALQELSEN